MNCTIDQGNNEVCRSGIRKGRSETREDRSSSLVGDQTPWMWDHIT